MPTLTQPFWVLRRMINLPDGEYLKKGQSYEFVVDCCGTLANLIHPTLNSSPRSTQLKSLTSAPLYDPR